MYGFIRIGAASIKLRIGDIESNCEEVIKLLKEASSKEIKIVVFPELTLTGYTLGDLFFQESIFERLNKALSRIVLVSKKLDTIGIIGSPLFYKNRIFNAAFIIEKGEILGIVPKKYIPNYKEFYEKRWFASGGTIKNKYIDFLAKNIPFGCDLVFGNGDIVFGVEICEDLWAITPPSLDYAKAGANLIFNLSASNEYVGKYEYRKDLVKTQSARCVCGYVYASSSVQESTTDLLYGGDLIISENGIIISQNNRFTRESQLLYSEIDILKLKHLKGIETTFFEEEIPEIRMIKTQEIPYISKISRFINPHPFVPHNKEQRKERAKEIFSIQVMALAKRIEFLNKAKMVIGVSGGLDSTLALLVCEECANILNMKKNDIVAVTMPGFGTTPKTYTNAVKLCKLLNVDLREIDIQKSVELHLKEIGVDSKECITFENAQARERTQILMDLANKENGIVVGTGDLSEIALGFCTFNADHISMYNVNAGVPKTLVKYLIEWFADGEREDLKKILLDIANTPFSPELLPSKKKEISQKTEEIVGPYELHDFFMYHFLKYGASGKKILFLSSKAFKNKYSEKEIKKWLKIFFKRFFANQFKRNCMPDGVKVGSITLSPRGDWRMPSDVYVKEWIEEID